MRNRFGRRSIVAAGLAMALVALLPGGPCRAAADTRAATSAEIKADLADLRGEIDSLFYSLDGVAAQSAPGDRAAIGKVQGTLRSVERKIDEASRWEEIDKKLVEPVCDAFEAVAMELKSLFRHLTGDGKAEGIHYGYWTYSDGDLSEFDWDAWPLQHRTSCGR